MITRIWRGWTSLHNAQAYQDLLVEEMTRIRVETRCLISI